MPTRFTPGPLSGLILVQPQVFSDSRGSFFETYKQSEYQENGITETFVQDNHSISTKGVVRGLHFQTGSHTQGKLVRVVQGAVWDVAVDCRPTSPTFGQWYGLEISAENRTQIYIPPGFAHGFMTLSNEAEFCYKCTAEYHRQSEVGIKWDDLTLAIDWPLPGVEVTVSEKDSDLPSWNQWLRGLK